MKKDDKDMTKNMGKKAGKAALGLGKAWFHASVGLANVAIDNSIGVRRGSDARTRHQFEKAADALKSLKDINKED